MKARNRQDKGKSKGKSRRTGASGKGQTCARCGRVLTDVERYVAELMPPALCRDCSNSDLEHLKMVLGLAGRRGRGNGLRAAR